jgi:hypothetical protein
MVCDAYLFILPIAAQAGLEVVVAGRNGAIFSQCSTAWGGFPWARGSGCRRVRFWLVLCFCLMEEGEEKGKKKKRREKLLWERKVSWG